MLEVLQNKIDALRRFKDETNILVKQIVEELDYVLIDMNVENQLYELGINIKEVSLMSYAPYSATTRLMKFLKHQPTNRVTLRDTGDFYQSFKVVATIEGFELEATDFKTEKLVFKYGKDIIGLTDKNLSIFVHEYIYPELNRTLREWLEN